MEFGRKVQTRTQLPRQHRIIPPTGRRRNIVAVREAGMKPASVFLRKPGGTHVAGITEECQGYDEVQRQMTAGVDLSQPIGILSRRQDEAGQRTLVFASSMVNA